MTTTPGADAAEVARLDNLLEEAHPVTRDLPAGRERAFSVLEDTSAFEYLVTGARRIRSFDPRWPETGTSVHHTVGIPPLLVRDRTDVVLAEPGRRLLLRAHIRPFGVFIVDFRFEADEHDPSRCRLVVREVAESGPLARTFLRPLVHLAIAGRNRDICRRYRRLVQRKEADPLV